MMTSLITKQHAFIWYAC